MELNEAKKLAVGLASPGEVESVRLEEALGRVLAETLSAHRDLPGEGRSRLDGFALRSSDTAGASPQSPISLKTLPGILAAGHASDRSVGSGECIRILTGAPLPRYADAVAPQEETVAHGEQLFLEHGLKPGKGVTPRGEDIRQGELLLSKGQILTPTRLALVAALGYARVPVARRPRVALLATGDEVKEVGESAEGPWTYCNNRHLLAWLVQLQGGIPVHLGVAADDPEAIIRRMEAIDADLVITTGGMGRGDKDFVLEAWKALGIRTLFREIDLSPGRNSALGIRGAQIFWGLSGNPWGAQVVFQELVAPVLWRCQGATGVRLPCVPALLEASVKKKNGLYKAVRGILKGESTELCFAPAEGRGGESIFTALKDRSVYIILESHVVEVPAGSRVQVHLSDFPLVAFPVFGTASPCAG